jgi:two-component system, chemotaxis family, chemotaxis protein CheY
VKILVVDDSRAMRMLVLSNLNKAGFNKHEFCEASDGLLAIDLIKKEDIDVVISDWNMDKMSGIDCLTELNRMKAANELQAVPKFVFVTSESTDEMRNRATEQGAKVFITKPFTLEVFEEKLKGVIS